MFRIMEINDFKQLPHITLAFRPGNDAAVKQVGIGRQSCHPGLAHPRNGWMDCMHLKLCASRPPCGVAQATVFLAIPFQ